MSQKISLGNQVVNFAFLGDIEINPNSLCEDQTIPNQVYGSTCNRSSITYNVTGATTGTTYMWGTPTAPLSGSAQPVPQNDFSQGNITIIGNLAAMTPQTGSFSLTGITNGVCSSNPFNVTVYVAPKPYITNKTATINADWITSAGTFNVVPVYNNATNNVVPSGTTYTWTTTAVSGITGNSNQTIPQTGISQTLVTSLVDTPATVIYTVTPSTSVYGTTCVGDPFTVTVTVNPRPLRIKFDYFYGAGCNYAKRITNIYVTDGATVISIPDIFIASGGCSGSGSITQDFWYPLKPFSGGTFNLNRCICKATPGTGILDATSGYMQMDAPSGRQTYNIPSFLIPTCTITIQCNNRSFSVSPTEVQYGQAFYLDIHDL